MAELVIKIPDSSMSLAELIAKDKETALFGRYRLDCFEVLEESTGLPFLAGQDSIRVEITALDGLIIITQDWVEVKKLP